VIYAARLAGEPLGAETLGQPGVNQIDEGESR
jgi:hypothetical protein